MIQRRQDLILQSYHPVNLSSDDCKMMNLSSDDDLNAQLQKEKQQTPFRPLY